MFKSLSVTLLNLKGIVRKNFIPAMFLGLVFGLGYGGILVASWNWTMTLSSGGDIWMLAIFILSTALMAFALLFSLSDSHFSKPVGFFEKLWPRTYKCVRVQHVDNYKFPGQRVIRVTGSNLVAFERSLNDLLRGRGIAFMDYCEVVQEGDVQAATVAFQKKAANRSPKLKRQQATVFQAQAPSISPTLTQDPLHQFMQTRLFFWGFLALFAFGLYQLFSFIASIFTPALALVAVLALVFFTVYLFSSKAVKSFTKSKTFPIAAVGVGVLVLVVAVFMIARPYIKLPTASAANTVDVSTKTVDVTVPAFDPATTAIGQNQAAQNLSGMAEKVARTSTDLFVTPVDALRQQGANRIPWEILYSGDGKGVGMVARDLSVQGWWSDGYQAVDPADPNRRIEYPGSFSQQVLEAVHGNGLTIEYANAIIDAGQRLALASDAQLNLMRSLLKPNFDGAAIYQTRYNELASEFNEYVETLNLSSRLPMLDVVDTLKVAWDPATVKVYKTSTPSPRVQVPDSLKVLQAAILQPTATPQPVVPVPEVVPEFVGSLPTLSPEEVQVRANDPANYPTPRPIGPCDQDYLYSPYKWASLWDVANDLSVLRVEWQVCPDGQTLKVTYWYAPLNDPGNTVGFIGGWSTLTELPPNGLPANVTRVELLSYLVALTPAPVILPTSTPAGPVYGPNCIPDEFRTDLNSPVQELTWTDARQYMRAIAIVEKLRLTTCGGNDNRVVLQIWILSFHHGAGSPNPSSWFIISSAAQALIVQLDGTPIPLNTDFYPVLKNEACQFTDLPCVAFAPGSNPVSK